MRLGLTIIASSLLLTSQPAMSFVWDGPCDNPSTNDTRQCEELARSRDRLDSLVRLKKKERMAREGCDLACEMREAETRQLAATRASWERQRRKIVDTVAPLKHQVNSAAANPHVLSKFLRVWDQRLVACGGLWVGRPMPVDLEQRIFDCRLKLTDEFLGELGRLKPIYERL